MASLNPPIRTATIIDGKSIAATIRKEIKEEITKLMKNNNTIGKPGIAMIIVGNRPDSATYVRNKTKAAIDCGFEVQDYKFDDNTNSNNNSGTMSLSDPKSQTVQQVTEQSLLDLISKLNHDPSIHGIILQLPLPSHLTINNQIDEDKLIKSIALEKDVDGFNPWNLGSIAMRDGIPYAISCTPKGVLELLKRSNVILKGKKVTVIGRSNIVGTPLALLLMREDATVTICHSQTQNLKEECLQADILCVCCGKPEYLRGDWIKEGAVVIDIGIHSIETKNSIETKTSKFKLVGDVKFDEAIHRASMITPVPGGVGPMTIAMLLQNTMELWKRSLNNNLNCNSIIIDNT